MADFDPVSYMMGQKAGPRGGGSSTLSGLTDVDISNPTNGQTLVYNAETGKWENGTGGGGGDIFETLGTISAATVPMSYDEEDQEWYGGIITDITATGDGDFAGRNLALKIDGQLYSVELVEPKVSVDISETATVYLNVRNNKLITLSLYATRSDEPVITDLSMEVYAPTPELAVFLNSHTK